MSLGSIANQPSPPASLPCGGRGEARISARLRSLQVQQVVTIVLFIALFTMAVRVPTDTDMWWHLRSGRYILETRGIPHTDPFSFTKAGAPWIDQSWLAQVGLYEVSVLLGEVGLGLLVAALATLAFAFVYRQCEGGMFLRAFTLILAATVSGVIWAPRPQMVSFLLTAAVGYVLYRYKRTPARISTLFWLPPIFLLWVNVHAGYVAGFILIGCYLVGETINRLLGRRDVPALSWREIGKLAGAAALSALVIPLNPNGVQMLLYPFKTVNIGVLQDFIQEWASPNFHQLYQQPFIWLLLAVLVALGLARRPADVTDLLLVGVFAYLGLLAGRNVALFALVAAPVVVRYGDAALRELRPPLPRSLPYPGRGRVGGPDHRLRVMLNWLIVVLVAAAAVLKIVVVFRPETADQAMRASLPMGAVEYVLDHRPAGPMFNSYNWGGFLIWALYPDYRVFVDGRTDLYDDAFLRDYLKVVMARPGWEAVLERHGVNLIVIERDSVLATFLEGREVGGWRLAYGDDLAAVFVREGR